MERSWGYFLKKYAFSEHAKSSKIKLNFGEAGRTGLNRYGGIVSEEWEPSLQGSKAAETYNRMATNDAIIGGELFAINMLSSQVPWFAIPGGEAKKDLNGAKYLESCMGDMATPWPMVLSEILTMVTHGWSWMEKVYKLRKGPRSKDPRFKSQYSDGYVGWANWAPRAQTTLFSWDYKDDSDELKGLIQMGPPDYQEHYIPRSKSLHFKTTSLKSNPEGVSFLRTAHRAWYFKNQIENVEAMGLERDLAGYPVLYVPAEIADPDPDAENYDELMVAHDEFLELITNIRRDEAEGLMLSSECDANGNRLYELKLLASSGMRQFNTNQIIMRYATAMATAIMGDFLLLGSGRQGSYALSETKARLFAQSIAALCDNICATINTDAVFELADFNPAIFEDLEKLPKVAHGHVEVPNLDTLAAFLQKLGYKVDWLKNDIALENYLRGKADLPLRTKQARPDQGTQTQSDQNADGQNADQQQKAEEVEA
jgi:hypothetical protein